MALFLEVTEGPLEGQRFRVSTGLRLGRTTGDILLPDPKVSSLHAQIESSGISQYFLLDRDSSNGIRIHGQRVKKVALLPGVRFQIGKSFFHVIDIFIDEQTPSEKNVALGWKDVLKKQIPQLKSSNQSRTTLVHAIVPALELHFLEGIQADSKITLGYGPRRVGADSLDVEIYEPHAPDIAFEIFPEKEGCARFRTAHPTQVQLNDQAVETDILKSGDQIRIGSSLIEVKFLE